MTTWRLDIDEGAIYCGHKRVAELDTRGGSNDEWREACRVGQEMVDALNGPDRAGFEARMLAAGHSRTALTRTKCGGYLSPTVHSEWRSECAAASYNGKDAKRIDWLARAGDVSLGIIVDAPGDGMFAVHHDLGASGIGKTLRAAIDAAMTGETR